LAKDPSLLLLKALLLWGNYSAGSYHSGTEVRRVERTFEKKNPRIAYCSTAPSPRYCSLHWGCQDEALLTTPECSPILPGTKVLSSLLYCPSNPARDEALLTATTAPAILPGTRLSSLLLLAQQCWGQSWLSLLLQCPQMRPTYRDQGSALTTPVPPQSCQGRGSPHCSTGPSNPARDEALLTATTAPAILPGTRLSSQLYCPSKDGSRECSPRYSSGPAMLGTGNALLTTLLPPNPASTYLPGPRVCPLLLQSAPK